MSISEVFSRSTTGFGGSDDSFKFNRSTTAHLYEEGKVSGPEVHDGGQVNEVIKELRFKIQSLEAALESQAESQASKMADALAAEREVQAAEREAQASKMAAFESQILALMRDRDEPLIAPSPVSPFLPISLQPVEGSVDREGMSDMNGTVRPSTIQMNEERASSSRPQSRLMSRGSKVVPS